MSKKSINHITASSDPSTKATEKWPSFTQEGADQGLDHFVYTDAEVFAGTHLLIDLWGAQKLDDIAHMELAMREAVDVAGATLLHIHLHHFASSGGISGVTILAESHISVHTWPERDYAAFDVFMCGSTDPQLTIDVFKRYFTPEKVDIRTVLRGKLE